MKRKPDHIDKILPFGELLRGFSNQSYITRAELNKFLKTRGIFHRIPDKAHLVPCISTLLLSPTEFDELREFQNTREDTRKKSTSRIEWNSNMNLGEAIKNVNFKDIIPSEGINFKLTAPPSIQIFQNDPNRIIIGYEIERNDLNKSWYESNNTFTGQIEIGKTEVDQLRMVKTYTSSESDKVGNEVQKHLIHYFKQGGHVLPDKVLEKVLFGDFNNEDRIVFFYRLSTNMRKSIYFEFEDIINIEFTPENTISLPTPIEWMENKTELKLKGKDIHNTFFIRDKEYHQYLKFWEMESRFTFDYKGIKGVCTVVFSFKDYLTKGDSAEFTINISKFNVENSSEYTSKTKTDVKRSLLDIFDKKKDETYIKFLKYIEVKATSKLISTTT